MSTTSHPKTPAAAPWRDAFLDHLTNSMASPEFVLSTLHAAPQGSPVPYVPRARFCIFRGFWAELPENKHNDAPKNARAYASDLPTLTTDARMDKVPELFGSSKGKVGADGKDTPVGGSGGGGPVEAVWWVKEANVQWRVRGAAFVVGPDVDTDGEASGVRTLKSEVGRRMRVVDEGGVGDWSWTREVTGHFGNLSPGMRGSFKQPPPGQPKDEPYDDSKEKMGEKLTGLDDPVARENFRVVIIRPDEVEMTDLDPENSRRERHAYDASSDTWTTTTTWP